MSQTVDVSSPLHLVRRARDLQGFAALPSQLIVTRPVLPLVSLYERMSRPDISSGGDVGFNRLPKGSSSRMSSREDVSQNTPQPDIVCFSELRHHVARVKTLSSRFLTRRRETCGGWTATVTFDIRGTSIGPTTVFVIQSALESTGLQWL